MALFDVISLKVTRMYFYRLYLADPSHIGLSLSVRLKERLKFTVFCNILWATILTCWTLNIPGIQFHTTETVKDSLLYFPRFIGE